MNCPKCKNEMPIGSNYCAYCGVNITDIQQNYLEGIRFFSDGAYQEALKKLELAYIMNPEDPVLIKDVAHAYFHNGELSKAAQLYEKNDQYNIYFADVKFNQAILKINERNFKQARNLFIELVNSKIEIKSGKFYLGLLFDNENLFLSECYLYLGMIAKEDGRFEEAIEHFETSIKYNKSHLSSYHNLADMYLHMKNYPKAIEYYNIVLSSSPISEEMIDAQNNLGTAYFESGKSDEAIRIFNFVLDRDPGNPIAIRNLNRIYEKQGLFTQVEMKKKSHHLEDIGSPIFGLIRTVDDNIKGGNELQIIGNSQSMLRVMRYARLAAASDSTVLITGENGTGKELIALAIYMNSNRKDRPFIVVNCAAIPEPLLESDLFGHEKGAFTDAFTRKLGRFEIANHGTIFLDEIGDLSPGMQVKILRVLQHKEFTRVGGVETIKVDVRIIAATNRNLKSMIEDAQFREDLYYRLNVIPIHIPPLRDRVEDIPILIKHFINKYCKHPSKNKPFFTEEEIETLIEYHWPGNVRELENMIERAVVMGTKSSLYLEEFAKLKKAALAQKNKLEAAQSKAPDDEYDTNLTLEDVEKKHIIKVLINTEGNQRKTAKVLGINPSTLWRKMKYYNIQVEKLQSKITS